MTITEINNLTVDDVKIELQTRLDPSNKLNDGDFTQQQLDDELVKYKEETIYHVIHQVYQKRKQEYPTTEELIVAMWEGDQAKIDELEAARQAVKTKYPKN